MIIRIIKVSAIVLAILVTYIIVSFYIAARPVELNDSDLVYHPKKIDDNKNAYIVLLPVLKQIKESKHGDQIDSYIWDENTIDYDQASRILEKHSSYLIVLSKALELNSFQVPIVEDYKTKDETYMMGNVFLYRLELLKIKKLLYEGKEKAAPQEILKLLKYGYLLQNSDGYMLAFILGSVAKDKALTLIQEWVAKSNLDSTYYIEYINHFEKYDDNSSIVKALKREYTVFAKHLTIKGLEDDTFFSGIYKAYRKDPERMRYLYNENATINKLAEYYRHDIKDATGPYADIKLIKIYSLPSNRFLRYLSMLSGNPIGKHLLSFSIVPFDRIVRSKFELDAECNLTKLLLSIKAYHVDKKKFPATLDELVPTYINAIPKDPFDDKKLKYSKKNKIIYSVGLDMQDNQGDKEKDIPLEVNFQH